MREGQEIKSEITNILGITPACAGRTLIFLLMFYPKRDHPRMCGKDDESRTVGMGI